MIVNVMINTTSYSTDLTYGSQYNISVAALFQNLRGRSVFGLTDIRKYFGFHSMLKNIRKFLKMHKNCQFINNEIDHLV